MSDTLAVLQTALAGRYRLERSVGQGGMGVVYLAHDLKHDRAVAIKVLRPEVAILLGRERFLREIGIAAQLSHPHIIPLHDSGEAAGHLYYVMPYVPGQTLRERLDRGGPLPPDEALGITRQVATALAHAHGRGVIHRDIKPSNILLSEGFALVADFGLARALSGVTEGGDISSVGLAIGTPRYMSPEQAVGAAELDGRSDLFSLGCVLREMLLGTPDRTPVPGSKGSTPLPAGSQRPEIPEAIRPIVARLMAPDPAKRYANAQELLAELGQPAVVLPSRRRLAMVAGGIGLAVLLVWGVPRLVGGVGAGGELDTTRFAVLPFDRMDGAPVLQADVPIRTALSRWTGISVVGGLEVSEALKNAGSGPLDRNAASGIARQLGAGRYVRGQVVRFGDSVQVEAVVYDTRTSGVVIGKSIRIPRNLSGADAGVAGLVDSVLFRGAMPAERFAAPAGSTSVPAMWAFIEGREAIAKWDLPAADSAFGRALALDPTFGRAALWLAQVRMWQRQPANNWRSAAGTAAADRSRLGSRDTALASLLAEVSRGEYGTACPRWLDLTEAWPDEFPVWYGSATCLVRDPGVLRDRRSPTGWRYRSSYQQAQRAWQRAFALLPAIYRDYRAGGPRSARWLLWTEPTRGRSGVAIPPDTGLFNSWPAWQGDTLAFVPRRAGEFTSGRVVLTSATTEAVTQQRLAFYDLATEWMSSDPGNIEAREAVALALWSLGNPAAIDSIAAARRRARSVSDRARLGISEALMRLLSGASDSSAVAAARRLADSVLSLDPDAPGLDPWDLATAAALTGQAARAALFIRRPSARVAWRLPPALTGDALALLAFAALGGPKDSLIVLDGRVSGGIAAGVDRSRQSAERGEWLGRPLALVSPEVLLSSLSTLAGTGDYLIDAEVASARGDTATTMALLRRLAGSRGGLQPSALMFEALLPEARLLASMGDRAAAIHRLDPTLLDLRHVSLPLVNDPVGAGLLVRTMALRADLAMAVGDTATARRWARTVHTLWSAADPFLTPAALRMQGIGHPAVP